MSGYRSLAKVLAEIGARGGSRHRSARVLRFVFRHPGGHERIIGQLRRHQQRKAIRARKRFERMQRNA